MIIQGWNMKGARVMKNLLAVCAVLMCVSVAAGAETEAAPALLEHYAIAASLDSLDGPRLEAMGTDKGRSSCNDEEGNVFIIWKYSVAWIKCITLDGQVETISGDDRWPTDLHLAEGPTAYFPNMESVPKAGGTCIPDYGIVAEGYPLQGEDKGAVYVYWKDKSPHKIYKNKDKNDRWWFKCLGTPGKPKPPTTLGESVLIHDVDLTSARVGNGWISHEGNLFKFDSVAKKITCILTVTDYESRVTAVIGDLRGKKRTKSIGAAEQVMLADDGNMYLLYYLKHYPNGSVFKISSDLSTCELIVQHTDTVKGQNLDGVGTRTRWHCGPAWMRMFKNTPMLRAVDSATVRRFQDGRVAHLCFDGEWRERTEATPRRGFPSIGSSGYQPGDHGSPYIYIPYAGEGSGNDCRFFRIGPFDFTKPTIGSPAQDKGE